MTRWDVAVIALLIAAALAMAFLAAPRAQGRAYAVIERGGAVLYELPLDEDSVVTVGEGGAVNTVEVEDGVVRITDANCPDKLCMRGALGRSGGALVCLPHEMVVRVAARETRWDVVTP